jgi:hypothetical protein
MIAHLRGKLIFKEPGQAIVEAAGWGTTWSISVPTFTALPSVGAEASLHIHTQVSEDQIALFGFLDREEKRLFERLITVSGVGPKLAIKMLSGLVERSERAGHSRAGSRATGADSGRGQEAGRAAGGRAERQAGRLKFLRGLEKHNDREWFNERKAVYEAELKEPMLAIIRKVTDAMTDFAPNHVRPAEKSLFRIYRDTRFSNNKLPYKTHVAAWWSHMGMEKTSGAGYYFQVSPKGVVIAAGRTCRRRSSWRRFATGCWRITSSSQAAEQACGPQDLHGV